MKKFEEFRYDDFNKDYIDIKDVKDFLLRNYTKIGLFILFSLTIGYVYIAKRSPTYIGTTEHYISQEYKFYKNDILQLLKGKNNLYPVFIKLKNKKIYSQENQSFNDWRKNFKISSKPNSNILITSFSDIEEKKVIETLEVYSENIKNNIHLKALNKLFIRISNLEGSMTDVKKIGIKELLNLFTVQIQDENINSEIIEFIDGPNLSLDYGIRAKYLLLFLPIFGGFIGIFIALLNENIQDKIYNLREIRKILGLDLNIILNSNSCNNWDESISLFFNNINKDNNIENIYFYVLGDLENISINKLKNILNKLTGNINILFKNNLFDIKKNSSLVLIIPKGIKAIQINNSLNNLNFIDNKILGLITIE
tara:strand:+ start:2249 stop:3349 length:1101 start_codon:yes stop_codon:yes gene_type:complete